MDRMKNLSSSSPIVISAGFAALTVFGVAAPALAADQQDRSNADLVSLLNAQVAPRHPSARYEDASTGRQFTLDRTGAHTLLKYEDSEEVFALTVSNAQRGDEFLKNDVGQNVLKITELGNVILFMPGDKRGSPAGFDGQSGPIGMPELEGDIADYADAVGDRLAVVSGSELMIAVEPELNAYGQWARNALDNVERGFKRTSRDSSISKVELAFSRRASARVRDDVLTVGVAPHSGYAGAPSSVAVARALSRE